MRAATRSDLVFVAGCTLLALLLRVPFLDRSVWFDEACMSSQRIGTWDQLIATLYVDIHPPLFVTFMHVWGRLFGDGELALRLPALLSGLAALPLLFWTGWRLVGRTAARWAVLLLALSPAHVWYSAEARLYAPMVAITLLAFGTTERLLAAGDRRRRLGWLHAAVVVAMLALHYYLAVFVLALAVMAPMLAPGFGPAVRRLLLTHAIALLLLGAFVAAKLALGEFETSQDYLGPLTLGKLRDFVVDWSWSGHALLPADADGRVVAGPLLQGIANAGQGLAAGLLLLGLWRLVRDWRRAPQARLVLAGAFGLPLFLFACALGGYERTYLERTMIPALPFLLLLAGNGLAALSGGVARAAGALTLAHAVAALAALFVYGGTHWTVYKPNSDWRAAAAWLGREIDGDGAGRAVFTSTPNPRPLSYYDARIQDVKNLAAATDPQRLGASVRRRLGAWAGDLAERTFAAFAARNAALLGRARLRVHRSDADPLRLDVQGRSKDDVCYLLQDEWHPHRSADSSVYDLLADRRVQVLATARFPGIFVHKVRIAR